MARVRLNIFENKDIIIPHEGITLREFINTHIEEKYRENIIVYVNMKRVEELDSIPDKHDDVYFIHVPKDKDTLRTAVVLTAVIGASALMPQGTSVWIKAGVLMATSYAASKMVYSLLPVNQMGLEDTNKYNSIEASQTYYFNGQSNQTRRYGVVPRLYGRLKYFPNVAASPYIELEVDRSTGELVQFLNVIYDFGIGEYEIRDIRIGETDISRFSDVFYKVHYDTNFIYYKNDVNQDQLSISLDKNSTDIGVYPDDYQATRTSTGDRFKLLFHFPNGLYTQGTDGSTAERSVQLDVDVKDPNTGEWLPYYQLENFEIQCPHTATNRISFNFSTVTFGTHRVIGGYYYGADGVKRYNEYYYFTAGVSVIGFVDKRIFPAGISVGDRLYSDTAGEMGTITAIEDFDPLLKLTLDKPLERDVLVNTRINKETGNGVFILEDIIFAGFTLQKVASLVITANSPKAFYLSVTMDPPTSDQQYEFRVTRVKSWGGYTYNIRDQLTWIALTSYKDSAPITTTIPHTFLELKIKATGQLNGTISNLSAIVTSDISSNPADILVDLLTNSYINKNAVNNIDEDSIQEWREFCDEIPPNGTKKRYQLNFALDFNTTLKEMIDKVTSSALASLTFTKGKYGVIIDKNRTLPVQMFTDRNISNINITRNYIEVPEAIKVIYRDEMVGYEEREQIVGNSDKFEEINAFGVTNQEQAYRVGKYSLLQSKLRREVITFDVDFEHLACTRGDYVLFQDTVMKVGGFAARVKSVNGTLVTLDAPTDAQLGVDYGYTFRSVDGISSGTCQFTSSDTIDVQDNIPFIGDLIVVGELDKVTYHCIVKSIEAKDNLKATVTLVEKADALYEALDNDTIPEYRPFISNFVEKTYAPDEVENLSAENKWKCDNGGYLYTVELDWDAPLNSVVDVYEIYKATGESNYELVGYTSNTYYSYKVDSFEEHKFKVLGVSPQGDKLNLTDVDYVTITPEEKTSPPSDVDGLYINILSETIQFSWERVLDCDIKYYMIRFSPNLNATWESSIPLLTADHNSSMASVQARTGSYFIKAIAWNNVESVHAAKAITSIPNLRNINIIEETNDFPALTGAKDNVEVDSGYLLLKPKVYGAGGGITEYYPEGTYTFTNLLDLGEIYTVRLQSLVEAEGFNDSDLMSSWDALSDVALLSTSTVSDWNVVTQYRSTDQFITMDTWTTLSSVDYLDSGVGDSWTEWRDFTIGDFTGRIFQFRLKLISYKANVTPRVLNGIIRADMPDRIESYDNIIIPEEGKTIVYDPAFKGPDPSPVIQITQDNAQEGDSYVISDKTLEGFTIKFYNNGVAVSRQIDIMVKGYGRKHTEVL